MSDIPDAFGTAMEGGLYARAVQRETGEGSSGKIETDESGHFVEQDCLNCGAKLMGRHCHICGQQAHLHRTLSAVGHDLLHGVLHLDGKLWHTLPLLTLHPGKLTRRYIDGERADFVSPMAMFLFSVFLMFAIFQAIGLTTPTDIGGANLGKIGDDLAEVREDMVAERQNLREELAETRSSGANDGEVAAIEADIAEIDQTIAGLDRGQELIGGDGEKASPDEYDAADAGELKLFKKLEEKWRKNPGLMLYKLQANSYKFSWLLIPLSLPFVWLLFAWKRRFKAYDHAIFVTYSLAFMSLFFIALSLLGKLGIGAGWLFTIFATLAPLHIYRQLKQTYGLSRRSAIWRLLVLMVGIFIILTLFVQILVVLGAF